MNSYKQQRMKRVICWFCSIWMSVAALPTQAAALGAQAGSLPHVAAVDTAEEARSNLLDYLVEAGVDAQMAENRLAMLTDAEVTRLSAEIDTLPAGAGHSSAGFWAVIGAIFGFLFGWMLGDKHGHGHGHGHGHKHGHGHH